MGDAGSASCRARPRRRLRVAVAHDYLGVAERLADWTEVRALADVDFLSDAYADEAQAAEALAEYDIVCSLRERQPLTADLIRRASSDATVRSRL